ncbi:MAG: efflux RND transporter permease subunit [Elusimicrobia bacterium]|nr:efflux RND transporter permease subunit [Elusimicrobiota bacterium]
MDRDRAQDLSVKIEDIANNLRTMVGGEEDITKYKGRRRSLSSAPARGQNYRDRPDVISGLYVPSSKVGLVRLDSVATLVEARGPSLN